MARLVDVILPVHGHGGPPSRLVTAAAHLAVVVAVVAGAALLSVTSRARYAPLVGEDGVAEWATAAAYVVAAVLALLAARRLRSEGLHPEAVVYVLLGLALVVVAGEETSWLQRQLGFSGPEALVRRNTQGEANLHNTLAAEHLHGAFVMVGLTMTIGSRLVAPRVPRLRRRPWLLVPSAGLAPWFLVAVVYYLWVDRIDPVVAAAGGPESLVGQVWRFQEVVELCLGLGFLLFTGAVLRRLRVRQDAASARPCHRQEMFMPSP